MVTGGRRPWQKIAIVIGAIVVVAGVAVALVNPRLTRYAESDAFRAELEKQTAKGLHFPAGAYSPIRRTGFLSAAADSFRAENGRKALTRMDAHGITARFNAFGVFFRRLPFKEIHIQGGGRGLLKYPAPQKNPPNTGKRGGSHRGPASGT